MVLTVAFVALLVAASDCMQVSVSEEHIEQWREQRELVESIHKEVLQAQLRRPQFDENDIDDEKVTEICYDLVGCFSLIDGDMKHIDTLPISPNSISPKYKLYSKRHPKSEILLRYGNLSKNELAADFQEEQPLTFVAHGFGESTSKKWMPDMKDGLLEKKGGNVVLIDWYWGALKPLYSRATANSELMGRLSAVLIKELIDMFPETVKPKNIHFIGFSLGAQMAGFMGRWLRKTTGFKIGRITGLDAASPFFEAYNVTLTKNDADYVDAVHTSAGSNVLTGKLGVVLPYGHVDFYPNGGSVQPGCPFYLVACDHQRVYALYNEAIASSNCEFISESCSETSISEINRGNCKPLPGIVGKMGLEANIYPGQGLQYLTTNKKKPFCISNNVVS